MKLSYSTRFFRDRLLNAKLSKIRQFHKKVLCYAFNYAIIEQGRVINMIIQALEKPFSICKLPANSASFDVNKFSIAFSANADEACSLICPTAEIPSDVTDRNDGWRAIRLAPSVNKETMGLILDLAKVFAHADVGVLPVTTFATIYFFLRSDGYLRALQELQECGYKVEMTYLEQ